MCHISEGPSNAVWDLMNSTRNHSPNPVSEKLSNYQKMPRMWEMLMTLDQISTKEYINMIFSEEK